MIKFRNTNIANCTMFRTCWFYYFTSFTL